MIQQGRTDLTLVLWERVKKRVREIAFHRLIVSRGFDGRRGYTDLDDLMQTAFIAMVEAAKTYKPGGALFTTWLDFYLKNEFRTALGIRTSKRDCFDKCVSLDRPRAEDSDETIGDTIAGADCFVDVEEKIYREELRAALEKALDEIPKRQADVLRKTHFDGQTLKDVGEDMEISIERARQLRKEGLAYMRRNRGLKHFLDDSVNYYSRVGLKAFDITQERNTERLALKRMELERKYSYLFSRGV